LLIFISPDCFESTLAATWLLYTVGHKKCHFYYFFV